MTFAPKSGCPMCSIVSSATSAPASPSASSRQAEILWKDDNFTVYRESANPVSSKGHVIIVFNLHVPSIYTLSSSDLPILVTLRDIAHRTLNSIQAPSSPSASPIASAGSQQAISDNASQLTSTRDSFRIGFINSPFKDNKIPVTDHLHAHAYILPADRLGWWRGIAYSSVAWYEVDDLIAEIREETSNNRVRSGMNPRPIDRVPGAGMRRGTADGIETTDAPLGVADVEQGESVGSPMLLPPTPSTGGTVTQERPSFSDSSIPHLTV
ncbi:uncharacterized protein BXZ73DRAFT_51527 [Epithele typhae]|uniref:uncharacterized protein n=1 Tax=Epithele typhae TaxID=378194 RepID=UPI002007B1B6|nr:uncharacterized protein BXZ73DRAFT_51527 [Epithele typhae]KAH9921998.1 hypothetical protein BXZ73DRAFT_51527 [Epithele typhae]